jgi:hypothetical protein
MNPANIVFEGRPANNARLVVEEAVEYEVGLCAVVGGGWWVMRGRAGRRVRSSGQGQLPPRHTARAAPAPPAPARPSIAAHVPQHRRTSMKMEPKGSRPPASAMAAGRRYQGRGGMGEGMRLTRQGGAEPAAALRPTTVPSRHSGSEMNAHISTCAAGGGRAGRGRRRAGRRAGRRACPQGIPGAAPPRSVWRSGPNPSARQRSSPQMGTPAPTRPPTHTHPAHPPSTPSPPAASHPPLPGCRGRAPQPASRSPAQQC